MRLLVYWDDYFSAGIEILNFISLNYIRFIEKYYIGEPWEFLYLWKFWPKYSQFSVFENIYDSHFENIYDLVEHVTVEVQVVFLS
jgi:hypothetical protein